MARTPPKLSATCSSVKRARIAALAPSSALEQVGPRDDRAVALERAAVLEIEHLGDAAGDRSTMTSSSTA